MGASVRRSLTALVLLALLVGCGSSPPPAALPPVPTASAAVVVPAAAEPATPRGAEAFTRFWYAEITRAWAELDPSIVQRLSAPGCRVCQRYVESMTEVKRAGQTVDPVTFDLAFVEAQGISANRTRVLVIYSAPVTRVYDRSGRVVRTEAAIRRGQDTLELQRQGQSWRVVQ